MTWAKLRARSIVTALPSTKGEIDNLRSIVTRSLSDVAAASLSADGRSLLAYDAARTLSLIVVRTAGYRPKVAGLHHNIFVALETADTTFAALSAYFDGCRIKRRVRRPWRS